MSALCPYFLQFDLPPLPSPHPPEIGETQVKWSRHALPVSCVASSGAVFTSAIIMWQSKVPRPVGCEGFATCFLIEATTGGPKVILGTKWPSLFKCNCIRNTSFSKRPGLGHYYRQIGSCGNTNIMSTWSQSAPCSIVRAQSWPSCPKSAARMEGAMIVLGAIVEALQLVVQ